MTCRYGHYKNLFQTLIYSANIRLLFDITKFRSIFNYTVIKLIFIEVSIDFNLPVNINHSPIDNCVRLAALQWPQPRASSSVRCHPPRLHRWPRSPRNGRNQKVTLLHQSTEKWKRHLVILSCLLFPTRRTC